jgi:hypothetical protein
LLTIPRQLVEDAAALCVQKQTQKLFGSARWRGQRMLDASADRREIAMRIVRAAQERLATAYAGLRHYTQPQGPPPVYLRCSFRL